MTNKVSKIWEEAVMDGEQIRVGIFSSFARILIDGFDIHVHGNICSCDEVITAYKRQEEETEKAFRNLPDGWKQPSCCDDLLAISEEELNELILEYEKDRGQVINIKTRQSI
jgi:hypothetical protein